MCQHLCVAFSTCWCFSFGRAECVELDLQSRFSCFQISYFYSLVTEVSCSYVLKRQLSMVKGPITQAFACKLWQEAVQQNESISSTIIIHYWQAAPGGGRIWDGMTSFRGRMRCFFTVSTRVSNSCVYMCVLYLLFGWVEVFRSGLKEHFDLFALGDVDWQLNECLQVQKITGNLRKVQASTQLSVHTEVSQRLQYWLNAWSQVITTYWIYKHFQTPARNKS